MAKRACMLAAWIGSLGRERKVWIGMDRQTDAQLAGKMVWAWPDLVY